MVKVDRYGNLLLALQELHVRGDTDLNFVEVGTYDGNRAASLIRYWHKLTGRDDNACYVGFDLWEQMTQEKNVKEMSKKKLPPRRINVERMLGAVGKTTVKLLQGDTKDTLHKFADAEPRKFPQHECRWNLIYVDGGHSLETVASDWAAVQKFMHPRSIVLFDDYYLNKPGFGCQELIDGLHAPYSTSLLEPIDTIPDSGLQIQFARVGKEA